MATTSTFRAEVVGSLLRPDELKQARDGLAAGTISTEAFRQVEDDAVDQALAVQERAGLDVVTDGEQRRFIFTDPLTDAVEGIAMVDDHSLPWHDALGRPYEFPFPAVVAPIRKVRSIAVAEYTSARDRTTKPLKVTIPSPLSLMLMWSHHHSFAAYSDPFAMFADALDLLRGEAQALVDHGCRYIQVDAPEVNTLADPAVRARFEENGLHAARLLSEGMDLVNALPEGFPDDVRWGIHLCRGNYDGGWMGTGGYESISSDVFPRVSNYDSVFLEFDDERSGSFDALGQLPDDVVAVLGLVSTKRNDVETAEGLKDRIDDAGRVRDLDRLALSPQCGFASGVVGNPLTPEVQARKLALVAEVAHEVWA